MNKKIEKLKANYHQTPIPEELDSIIDAALRNGPKKKIRSFKNWTIGFAAAALLLLTGLNTNADFAHAMQDFPVVGPIMKVFTFVEFKIEEENFQADVKVPAIETEDKTLQSTLNEKYLEESKQLYEKFTAEMEEMKKNNGGNLGLSSGYAVVTDTENIFAIERYVVETAASGYETLKYDTIDKKNQLLITLPSLFTDDRYIDVISENIKQQMREQMEKDENLIYWIDETDEMIQPFQSIQKDQTFYINADGKLVIVFNEYEVAPGYMGTIQFIIPTEVIKNLLVSNEYIY